MISSSSTRSARPSSTSPAGTACGRSTRRRSRELADALSPGPAGRAGPPRPALRRTGRPTDAELRIAQAQLVGWLEGLFHGIQATLFAQQMAARNQLEDMRRQPAPGRQASPAEPGEPAGRRHLPLTARPVAPDPWRAAATGRFAPRRITRGVIRPQAVDTACGVAWGQCEYGRPRWSLRPPAHPHRVLDARRRGPGGRRRGRGRGRRPAGARHHRPRQHVRRPRLLQGLPGRRASSPIIGTEAYMAHESRSERPARRGRVDDSGGDAEGGRKLYYHLTLLAAEPSRLPEPDPAGQPGLPGGLLLQAPRRLGAARRAQRGLIATTGCLGGHVLQALLLGDEAEALTKAGRLQDIFGKDNLFVELQDHGHRRAAPDHPGLLEIARKLGAPLLATNDSHYTAPRGRRGPRRPALRPDRLDHDDPTRFKFDGDEHYLKSADEMRGLFPEAVPGACDNTLLIAERCNVEIEFGKPPAAAASRCPRASTDDRAYLAAPHPRRGPRQRWGEPLPDAVVERLDFELQVIADMGFSSYFLIVWDLIKHARDKGIRVGPGRGSAAGCCVAYCLRITDLDPINYDLLFERFLNPSRISDARHRHGLRLPLPGRDDPLRGRALRPGPRRPDRHLLHHQGPGRGARRRPGARLPVRRGRQGRQG